MPSPTHIGFIMDGNGRWANTRGLPRSAGHKAGFEHIPKVLEMCEPHNIKIVSAFAWSTENWNRPKVEVDYIMSSLVSHLMEFVEQLHKRDIRFTHTGSRQNLNSKTLDALDRACNLTLANQSGIFNLVFNYSGRSEIIHVAKQALLDHYEAKNVNEALVDQLLWSSGLPDIDLLIRTGYEKRISNFMLWQSSKAFLYFAPTFWPDFSKDHIESALNVYNNRQLN